MKEVWLTSHKVGIIFIVFPNEAEHFAEAFGPGFPLMPCCAFLRQGSAEHKLT